MSPMPSQNETLLQPDRVEAGSSAVFRPRAYRMRQAAQSAMIVGEASQGSTQLSTSYSFGPERTRQFEAVPGSGRVRIPVNGLSGNADRTRRRTRCSLRRFRYIL